MINEKEEELEKLRENRAEQKFLMSIFGSDEQNKIAKLEEEIKNLKKTYEEFNGMRNAMINSMPTLLANLNTEFDNIIEKIESEIESKTKELNEATTNGYNAKEKRINELKDVIKELEQEAGKFKNTYRTFARKFSDYTRKYVRRDRKYPSNELRNKIVLGTIGIAKYWAKVYFYKTENTVPFDDLFQIASQSLVSAAHYYIPSERATFSTYARRCIENKLKQEVYNKRKSKKLPYNPKDFFKKERDRIKYITLFLNVLRTKSRSGLTLYYSEKYIERTSVILDRFREQIRDHNREMKLRNELDRLLPSFGGKRTKERLDEIVERIIKMLNESKLRALVTDEDRNLASLYVNYQNKTLETQEIYELIYYLDCYKKKLDLIESYLTVEQDFMENNSGITPSDEEMLALLNKEVKKRNSERYSLRKDGMFTKIIHYKSFYDYYNVYKDTYDVDPFISSEEYDRGEYKSKEKEKDEILGQLEVDCDDLSDILMNMIDEIEDSDALKVVLCFSDNPFQIYEDWEVYEEGKDYSNGDVFDKEKAIERLYDISTSLNSIDNLDSEKVEEFLNAELKSRKDDVNAYLLEKNAPIIIQNQEIAELNNKLSRGSKYEKRFTMDQVNRIQKDIELLYEDDPDFFMLMYMDKKRRSSRSVDIPLEDKVINNLFLEDYYSALDELSEIEKQVLLSYYDINGIHSKTAKEIGSELFISERQVYNVKTRALRKLSQNSKLQEYNKK